MLSCTEALALPVISSRSGTRSCFAETRALTLKLEKFVPSLRDEMWTLVDDVILTSGLDNITCTVILMQSCCISLSMGESCFECIHYEQTLVIGYVRHTTRCLYMSNYAHPHQVNADFCILPAYHYTLYRIACVQNYEMITRMILSYP